MPIEDISQQLTVAELAGRSISKNFTISHHPDQMLNKVRCVFIYLGGGVIEGFKSMYPRINWLISKKK